MSSRLRAVEKKTFVERFGYCRLPLIPVLFFCRYKHNLLNQ
jgi:hypothetical protein